MENTSLLPIYDNLIPIDILRLRLIRDKAQGVKLVQVLTKHFGRRGEYYSRLMATEKNGAFYTYRLNGAGKVARSWVALSSSDVIVEKEIL